MGIERIVTYYVACNRVGCDRRSDGASTEARARKHAHERGWLVDYNGGDYCPGHMPPTPSTEAPASTETT